MNILINASNLKVGGGVQVAQSIIEELYKYPKHHFVVVYSDKLELTINKVRDKENIDTIKYNMPMSLIGTIKGQNIFLDRIVKEKNIDTVLTIFGPSRWTPKCLHISGFARPQLVLGDSPYIKELGFLKRIKFELKQILNKWLFSRNSDIYYTENPFISERLRKLFPNKRVFTVTNYYNQIFDKPELWDNSINLPQSPNKTFNLLTISANYPHKNLGIALLAAQYLKKHYPNFGFRFIMTIKEEALGNLSDDLKEHFVFLGPVTIQQCPNLYQQCDAMFLPTLMECFSASYAEAMRMKRPIITTDLGFAHSLCGNAAAYYDALSVSELANQIYKVANDTNYYQTLVNEGEKQLMNFDNYEQRTKKLLDYCVQYNINRQDEF